jgi:hypothetical protein
MIIENFVPNSYQKELLNLTTSVDFPWFYNESISGQKIEEFKNFNSVQYGFYHILYNPNGENSHFYKLFLPLIYFIEEKTKQTVKELIRVRVGMNTFVSNKETIHIPHVDYHEPHKVLLYYVNDSDGDTIMYNEVFSGEKNKKNFSIKEKISPKQGRAVLFDGLRYHSSSAPVNNTRRIAVNINFR